MQLLAELSVQFQQRFEHWRKASYHGACLCDAHFAAISKKLVAAMNASMGHHLRQQRDGPHGMTLDAPPAAPTDAAAFAEWLPNQLENTAVKLFPFIERDGDLKPDIKTLKMAIKSMHAFTFKNAETVLGRHTVETPEADGVEEEFDYKKPSPSASASVPMEIVPASSLMLPPARPPSSRSNRGRNDKGKRKFSSATSRKQHEDLNRQPDDDYVPGS
jgi:hypothetical protein